MQLGMAPVDPALVGTVQPCGPSAVSWHKLALLLVPPGVQAVGGSTLSGAEHRDFGL